MNETPKPRRRWCQYSLRSLFVVMTAACIGMSWPGVKMREARRQKDTVEEIQKLGGWVWYEHQVDASSSKVLPTTPPPVPAWLRKLFGDDFFQKVACVYLNDTQVVDDDLALITNLSELNELLDLSRTQVTDMGLQYLKAFTRLESLRLSGTKITDNGLDHLTALPQLTDLSLDDTTITDEGLERLKALPQLQTLILYKTNITDAGMAHLKELSNLRCLILTDTKVTERGLDCLKGLSHLEQLDIFDIRITEAGLKRLQQALPNCTIGGSRPD
jgi:hypothetical protein